MRNNGKTIGDKGKSREDRGKPRETAQKDFRAPVGQAPRIEADGRDGSDHLVDTQMRTK